MGFTLRLGANIRWLGRSDFYTHQRIPRLSELQLSAERHHNQSTHISASPFSEQ
jgi:hypothetical protein